jgi:hypothetical protein
MRGVPNFDELINPPNDEVAARVKKLRELYKMYPREMKAVNEKYGRVEKDDGEVVYALDWRKPETQAIYWAMVGLKRCRHNPSKENDLRKLERIVYQSMMYSFDRGKLNTPSGATVPPDQYFNNPLLVVPNMDLIERTHQSYIDMATLAKKEREANVEGTYHIAHMNFLRRVVEWNYYYNREDEALKWLKIALETYPGKMMYFTGTKKDKEGNWVYDMDKFVLHRLKDAVNRGSIDKTLAIIIGLMIRHFTHLALGENEEAASHLTMAENLHQRFVDRFSTAAKNRVSLPPFDKVKLARLRAFLVEEDPVLTKRLRTVLGLKEGELPEEPQVQGQGPQPNPNQ